MGRRFRLYMRQGISKFTFQLILNKLNPLTFLIISFVSFIYIFYILRLKTRPIGSDGRTPITNNS